MKRQHLRLAAAAATLITIAALVAGMPLNTVLAIALVLACPLIMLFMHGLGGRDHATRDHERASGDQSGRDAEQTHRHNNAQS